MARAAKETDLKVIVMTKGISEIVGKAEAAGKSRVTIYRALKQLLCAACSEPIKEGALFTRRSLFGQGLRILSQCEKCAPFSLPSTGEKERRQSALLDSLLTPQPEPKPEPSDEQQEERKPGAEREAVERRLGEALRRCRQRAKS